MQNSSFHFKVPVILPMRPGSIKRYRFFSFILAGLCCLAASFACAQEDTTVRQKLNELSNKVDSVQNKVDSVQKSQDSISKDVDELKDTVLAKAISTSFSKSHDEAVKHPETLYKHPLREHVIISIIAFIFLGLLLWFSFKFLVTSALCRDATYYPDCSLKEVRKRSFSYSRVQLFWWTIIILFCYVLFFALYGILLPLNSTVILLLGSGIAVFIFGKAMDKDQVEKNEKDGPSRHQDLYDSQGFLTDILSDDNGISIHRLQAVAFNIIYGIGFLSSFFSALSAASDKKFTYPFIEFEPWQLSLLGISAVGYLGLKSTENSVVTKDQRKASAAKDEATNPDTTNGSPEEPLAEKRTDITN